jgi:hypothetical protein
MLWMTWGWNDDAKAKNGLNTLITSTYMQCPGFINLSSKSLAYNQWIKSIN